MTRRVVCCAAMLVAMVTMVTTQLTSSEKKELLRIHNHFRRNVYPAAADMVKLQWDDDLAQLAHFWAANCEYERNEHRHDQSSYYDYVGENIAATANFTYNLTRMVQNWWEEKQYYDFSTAYCSDGNDDDKNKRKDDKEEFDDCQSYTQLVWADTYKVGCATFRCSELRMFEDGDYGATLLVCDYGPGGAYQGQQPYTAGNSFCSSCPSNKPYCDNKLCSGESRTTTHYIWLLASLAIVGVASQLS